MTVPRPLGNDTFTVIRAPLVQDRDGTFERDWDNATEHTVTKANIQPFPLAEKLNFEEERDREFTRTAFRIYCPPDTDILLTDRVRWRGKLMDVFGEPGPWTRFSGTVDHLSLIARERVG